MNKKGGVLIIIVVILILIATAIIFNISSSDIYEKISKPGGEEFCEEEGMEYAYRGLNHYCMDTTAFDLDAREIIFYQGEWYFIGGRNGS